MKVCRIAILVSLLLFAASSVVSAADFGWIRDFNAMAQADSTGFRARLASRFQIGETQITTVIGNVKSAADAYMVFRMGEMSGHPWERVLDQYKANPGKGWGVLARRLGIKPGSPEFHALKQGHDLDGRPAKGKKGPKKGPTKKAPKTTGKGNN